MKTSKRLITKGIITTMLTIGAVFALAVFIPGGAMKAEASGDVSYIYYEDQDAAIKGQTSTGTKSSGEYLKVTSSTKTWNDGCWYVVDGFETSISDRVTVTGTANLILCDDAKLYAMKGIDVSEGNTLNIYGQIGGTGKLFAGMDLCIGEKHAGIGGGSGVSKTGGTITINGGTVVATGGQKAAGIGGGMNCGGGVITINGGSVTATGGEKGAGIGGGESGESGVITINGGSVTATGGEKGAGIGGGMTRGGGTITINGGNITATGGSNGSGIGGGQEGAAGSVTINGGIVTASGNDSYNGIGSHNSISTTQGTLTLGSGVTLYGGDDADHVSTIDPSNDDTPTYARRKYMKAIGPVAKIGETGYDALWRAVNKAENGDTIVLLRDAVGREMSTGSGGCLEIHKTLTIDLNGCTIDRGLTTSTSEGYVIWLTGSLTLVDSSQAGDGKITGGYSSAPDYGGGVYVSSGTFVMSGGSIIGNKSEKNGGGVYVQSGTFTMNGGTISGNNAGNSGGGVYVQSGTFTMNGGTISGNSADDGGGVCVIGGTFTMNGGKICTNQGRINGGGVLIAENRSFTMSDGTISGNNAKNGGGVFVGTNGTFTITGGTVTGNNSTPVNSNTTGNVYISTNGTCNISGSAVIKDNVKNGTLDNGVYTGDTACNVYLKGTTDLSVAGALTEGAMIGVTLDTPRAFTSGWKTNMGTANPGSFFMSDSSQYELALDNEEAALAVHSLTYIANGDTISYTCPNAGCKMPEETVTLKIIKPEKTNYGDAKSEKATLEGLDAFNAATGKTITAAGIKYVGRDGTNYTESATAPTGLGKYTAKITVEEKTASVDYEIAKADIPAADITAPTAKTLEYNGSAQELINAGSVKDKIGTMQYALGDETKATGTYSETIPTGTDAATYHVWYKVVGDSNHNDTEAKMLTVQIAEKKNESDDPNDQDDPDNQAPKPTPVSVASISLNITDTSITMKKGDTRTLTAKVLPENASNKEVEWSVTDASVATVSNGTVTAVEKGKTTVTATTKDGGFTASCEILVVDPEMSEEILKEIQSDVKYEQGYTPAEETKKEDVPLNDIPKAKIDGEEVPVPVTATYQPAVSYTGKSIKGEQLVEKFDKTSIISGLTLKDGAKITDPLKLIDIKYTNKSNKNAGNKDAAYFTAKITINKNAKKSLSAQDYKTLQKKVAAVNKELKKKANRYKFTINKRSVTDGKLIVSVKKNADKSIKTKGKGGVYKVNSIKLETVDPFDPTQTLTIKVPAKNYKIEVVDAKTGLVKVTGKKNFTGQATVYVE